jgi:hypothetical protein
MPQASSRAAHDARFPSWIDRTAGGDIIERVDMGGVPLEPEDRAILDLESATIAGHTCKVIRIGPGAPGLEDLRALVDRRLGGVPELSWRLGGTAEEPAWVPADGFDVSRRVRPLERDDPLRPDEIPAAVATLFAERLDRERPLWQIHHAPLDDGGAVLIWRIHHALADGTACIRFAHALLWDDEPAREPARKPTADHPSAAGHPDHHRRRSHLAGFLEREFGESIRRSPFDGRIGTRRHVALASVELGPLHDAAKRLAGATLNDAVLSVVAGALRRWLVRHHGALGGVRVRVPVSLHHEGDAVANRDSFFSLRLPLHESDPVRRLTEIHAATAVRKEDDDAETRERLIDELRAVSPRLERFAERLEASPRSFAVSVSNVPGPPHPVAVLGAPVRSMHTLAEIGGRHALRVAVVSLAGSLNFGFIADPAIVDDLEEMAAGVEAEAADLESS